MDHEKIIHLNDRLSRLIERLPRMFDSSILKDRDRLLAYFDNDFIQKRSSRHLLRILLSQHLQRKKLLSNYPLKIKSRSVEFRIIPGKLQYPFTSKKVLGIMIQISISNRYELFDEETLRRSVERILPHLHMIKGSLYKFQGNNDTIKTCYAEFEKTGNQPIGLTELSLLKRSLGKELLERTERVVPCIFKVRNQEEVLRNILTLSQEIDHLGDLPQIMISFETQNSEEVIFTVIGVRAEDLLSVSFDNLIKQGSFSCRWVLERKQLVRYLQDHQPIVAYLFRVLLVPDESILRNDSSLNFFAARQKITSSLKESIGDYRDFNGGILIKQEEMLLGLRNSFPHVSPEQIENIFYSITPIEMQTILPRSTLQALIDLATQTSLLILNDAHDYHLVSSSKPPFTTILLHVPIGPLYEKAKDHFQIVNRSEEIQASFSFATKDSHLFGYLISLEDKKFYDHFVDSLTQLLLLWTDEIKQLKTLRLSLTDPIKSLDPRIGGDAISSILLKMLFEGLTRISPDGKLELSIADHVEISEDQRTYLFHLRPSFWSNGDPLTSQDFEYAWKKILSPDFNAPYTYLFFCIENAERAKKGLATMQDVGIHSINDHLLKIELSTISPHFLELLTLPIFSPIHRFHDVNIPNWPFEERHRYVCNGAFKIEKTDKDSGHIFIKNPLYLEKDAIKLDRVVIAHAHPSQSYELFLQNQIHWLGAPFGTWDNHYKAGPLDIMMTHQDNGLFWAVCQTEHPLLKNKKIRKALSLAIDRQALLHTIGYLNAPAFSPLPPIHSQISDDPYPFSPERAKELWNEGIAELGLSMADLSPLEITFARPSFITKQTADFMRRAWEETFHLRCRSRGVDFEALFKKFSYKDFQLSLIRWQPWVNDPFYTLNCFTSHESPFNFCQLLGPQLIELIKTAQMEKDNAKRKAFVKQLEEALVDEIPIIPLFKTYYQSMRKKNLMLEPNHTLMDFKWARFEQDIGN